MYIIVDDREQLWGYFTTKEKATEFIEAESSSLARLRTVYIENLEG